MVKPKIFLGGTVAGIEQDDYRWELTEQLVRGKVRPQDIFNPLVDSWDEEAMHLEELVKSTAEINLFVLVDPYRASEGHILPLFDIVKAVYSLHRYPDFTARFSYRGLPKKCHARKSLKSIVHTLQKAYGASRVGFRVQKPEVTIAWDGTSYGKTVSVYSYFEVALLSCTRPKSLYVAFVSEPEGRAGEEAFGTALYMCDQMDPDHILVHPRAGYFTNHRKQTRERVGILLAGDWVIDRLINKSI